MAERDTSTKPGARSFRFEVAFFAAMTGFLLVAGTVYFVWSREAAGTTLLYLAAGLSAITGGYYAFQARLERADLADAGEPRSVPTEDPEAVHSSIWPFEMGVGLTVTCLGLVLGRFILLFGLVVTVHALVGWLEQSRRGH